VLKRKQKVTAAVDLPGVPAGTAGVVVVAEGITWIRYVVRFANGTQLGSLDEKYLRPVD
jgi:hypothetical protein